MARSRPQRVFPYRIPGVSVYKRADRLGENDPWLAAWVDPATRQRKTLSLTPHTDIAAEKAREVSRTLSRHKLGLIDHAETRYAAAAQSSVIGLAQEYHKHLSATGRTAKQASEVHSRLRWLIGQCDIVALSQMEAVPMQLAVNDGIEEHGWSLETANKYLKAARQFCRWLRRRRRVIREDIGETLELYNAATDPRHARRALTIDELTRLCAAARTGKPWVRGMGKDWVGGPQRELIYLTAAHTGLRRGELASLTHGSFDFEQMTVTVTAAASKHRRLDIQQIRADLADHLRHYLPTRPVGRRIFDMPAKAFLMIRHDLEAAGIPYRTAEGFADFHSLRHTYVTMMLRGGNDIITVQAMARLSDPRLLSRYGHVSLRLRRDALAALPPIAPPDTGDERQVAG